MSWTDANKTDAQGDWGQAAANNENGWGQAALNNLVSWGKAHAMSLGHAVTNLVGDGSFTGLLDTYPNAAAAYSLRQLSSTYTGDAVVVRRASDNGTQSIGFVANELDVNTLETFCAGTDGYVATWYDQSGNGNDVIQATATNQPPIVSSGYTILKNGKPALSFTNHELQKSIVSVSGNAYSFFGVADTTGSSARALFRNRDLGGFGLFEGAAFLELLSNDDVGNTFMDDGVGNAIQASRSRLIDGNHLISTHYTLSTAALYIDSIKNGTSSMGSGSTPLIGPIDLPYLTIGGKRYNRPWEDTIQEIVLYNNDKLSVRSSIETNINDFYSIY